MSRLAGLNAVDSVERFDCFEARVWRVLRVLFLSWIPCLLCGRKLLSLTSSVVMLEMNCQ
jgi:hypothetical protein